MLWGTWLLLLTALASHVGGSVQTLAALLQVQLPAAVPGEALGGGACA